MLAQNLKIVALQNCISQNLYVDFVAVRLENDDLSWKSQKEQLRDNLRPTRATCRFVLATKISAVFKILIEKYKQKVGPWIFFPHSLLYYKVLYATLILYVSRNFLVTQSGARLRYKLHKLYLFDMSNCHEGFEQKYVQYFYIYYLKRQIYPSTTLCI